MRIHPVSLVFIVLAFAPAAFAIINPPFDDLLRGDANDDHRVDVADPVTIGNWLFNGQGQPVCLDAADANDDGAVDISDSTYLFTFLFFGGDAPKQPFPDCGPDPSADSLDCLNSACR